MKRNATLILMMLTTSAGLAADLIWTGAVDSKWDIGTTANWKVSGTDESRTFANADTVTFDDTAENKIVNLGANNLKPKTITFDNDEDYTFTSTLNKTNYIGRTVSSFTKKGTGTLTISTAASSYDFSHMYCDFDLQAGTVVLSTANNEQLLGDGGNKSKDGKLFKVNVRSGATLRMGKLTLGSLADVIVEDGGTLDWDGTAWSRQKFANLTLYGGASFNLSVPVKSDSGYELFAVTNQLRFTGTKPFVLDQDETHKKLEQPLGLLPTTQIRVDDVTGDEGVDATINLKMADAVGAGVTSGGAFVKTGAGTLLLGGNNSNYTSQGRDNSFTGDIVVREGTLMAGTLADTSFTLTNILGSTAVARTVTVESGATFCFPCRNLFGSAQAITNPVSRLSWDIRGTLAVSNGQSEVLGNITFDGGSLKASYGLSNFGRLLVSGKMMFKGAKTYAFPMADAGTMKANSIALNGYPATEFNVEDQDGIASFDVPFLIPGTYFQSLAAGTCGEFKFGFRKTGAGTMRIAAGKLPNETVSGTSYTNRGFNGVAAVEAGTLVVDGNISVAEGVSVSSGAYLAGTGTVSSVTLADGAGFRVRSTDADPLKVTGNLTAEGAFGLYFENEPPERMTVATVAGSVSGTFENASVYVNGETASDWKVVCRNNALSVQRMRGFSIILK